MPASLPTAAPARDASPLSSRSAPNPFDAVLVKVLASFLSELNAAAVVSACARTAGLRRDQLGPQHVPALIAQVEATFDFFGVSVDRRAQCLMRLRALQFEQASARSESTFLQIEREGDIVRARVAGRMTCQKLGFSEVGTAKVVTAISELSRNIVKYAGRGSITLRATGGSRVGVEVIATDQGPGIANVEAVMRPGFKSKTGMGAGLRGTRAIMDSFEIRSAPGQGTTVTIRKEKS